MNDSRGLLVITGVLFLACGLVTYLQPHYALYLAPFLLADVFHVSANLYSNAYFQGLMGCFFLLCATIERAHIVGLVALLPILLALSLSRLGQLLLLDLHSNSNLLALAYSSTAFIMALFALWSIRAKAYRQRALRQKWNKTLSSEM